MKRLIIAVGVIAFAFAPFVGSSQGMGGAGNYPGYEANPITCLSSGLETYRCIPNTLEECDVHGQLPC